MEEISNFLKSGTFFGTKTGNLGLVYSDEWVGEWEEEHVAIIAQLSSANDKISLRIIDFEDEKFASAIERESVFKVNKFGTLRRHYKRLKKFVDKRKPNYCSVFLGLGEPVKEDKLR